MTVSVVFHVVDFPVVLRSLRETFTFVSPKLRSREPLFAVPMCLYPLRFSLDRSPSLRAKARLQAFPTQLPESMKADTGIELISIGRYLGKFGAFLVADSSCPSTDAMRASWSSCEPPGFRRFLRSGRSLNTFGAFL